MNRIDNFLNINESIIKELKPDFTKIFLTSKTTLLGFVLIILLIVGKITLNIPLILMLLPMFILLIGAVPALISCVFTSYYITTEKVIVEKGLIGRDYDTIRLDKVLEVKLDVTVIDTIFNTGSIRLCNANETDTILSNVKNPKAIVRLIQV